MAKYTINKSVGRKVEFKGLRAQYLFIFIGGLIVDFILFVLLKTAGVGTVANIFICLSGASGVVFFTFKLNRKYGEHGVMKILARTRFPRRIAYRKRIFSA